MSDQLSKKEFESIIEEISEKGGMLELEFNIPHGMSVDNFDGKVKITGDDIPNELEWNIWELVYKLNDNVSFELRHHSFKNAEELWHEKIDSKFLYLDKAIDKKADKTVIKEIETTLAEHDNEFLSFLSKIDNLKNKYNSMVEKVNDVITGKRKVAKPKKKVKRFGGENK